MNGISSTSHRAENDYYATSPEAAKWLLTLEPQLRNATILEPCCGAGHLSQVFTKAGLNVVSSDIADHGFGTQKDFFSIDTFDGHIVTNPPFSDAQHFASHALDIVPPGRLVCMFLKLTFLEGIKRRRFFNITPPRKVWVSSSRIICAPHGDFASVKGSAIAYGWFIWQKGWKGIPTLGWFN